MAITFVAGDCGAPAGSNPVTGSINTTGASLIVVVIIHELSSVTLTDSASNTGWTEVTAQDITPLTPDRIVRVFYKEAPTTSSTHTFTASGTSVFGSIGAIAFAGTATSSALDDQITGEGTTPYAPGAVDPTEDGEVIVTVAGNPIIATAISGGFTLVDSVNETGNGFGTSVGYLIQTTAASANPSWTCSSADLISVTTLTFKAAAAGSSSVSPSVSPSSSVSPSVSPSPSPAPFTIIHSVLDFSDD